MVKKYNHKRSSGRVASHPDLIGDNIFHFLQSLGGSRERAQLTALWNNWPRIMGEEFAWLTPVGHRRKMLLIAVEDAMEIQEATLHTARILELVNSYLGNDYFEKVRISVHASRKE